jgi:hypothetical protein
MMGEGEYLLGSLVVIKKVHKPLRRKSKTSEAKAIDKAY